jgi:2-polyprenyl-3-methyl-5-hydroxy-6-metoxy-1,4-benzoquinol methylase
MDPSDIARSYDLLALSWQQETPPEYGIKQLERAIRFATVKGSALDVGCGSQGRFIETLNQSGYETEGVDISREMIALAAQRHPAATFHTADICQWELPRKYSFISAWDSTFHLPIAQQEPVLKKLCDGLLPGGVFLFTCGGGSASEITGNFRGQELGYSTLGVEKFVALLIHFGCHILHVEYDQWPESHVYIVARKI